MSEKTNTVKLQRVLKEPPERVYKAFLDPEALVKWMVPYGFTARVHSLDARVGGSFKMSFTNFGTGKVRAFGGTCLELTPGKKLRHTDKCDDPSLPGEIQMNITPRAVMCCLGWQKSLCRSEKKDAKEGPSRLFLQTLRPFVRVGSLRPV